MNTYEMPTRTKPWEHLYEELGLAELPFDDRAFAAHISAHAASQPDQVALRYVDRSITYAEYDLLARKLANVLAGLGVAKGDVVGFMTPNIPQAAITLAAVSRIGAIGTGISQLLAPPEVAYQLGDAGVKVVLVARHLLAKFQRLDRLPADLEAVIVTDVDDHRDAPPFVLEPVGGVPTFSYLEEISAASPEHSQAAVAPDDIFMVQYTGGTTGSPKGAELSVRTLMHNVAMANGPDGNWDAGNEVVACAFPLFHVAGLSWLLLAARLGATYIVVQDPREVALIVDQMRSFPPTRLGAVPALFEMLLRSQGFAQIDFSRLIAAKTGAAPMSQDTLRELEAAVGKGKLSEVFGMTETGPCYTCHPPRRYKLGSVGFPAPGADVRIRDAETGSFDVPLGEAGEICTAGPQLMRGYRGRPDETAQALREIDGRLWMFSGDIGYMDEEGYLYVCDRAKDMLIVGGFKVFSVEVESKIGTLPFVRRCAIVGRPDVARPGNDIVALHVELEDDHSGTSQEELRAAILNYCRENMASYKAPKIILFIDAIPLTSVGKIDKKLLRGLITDSRH